MKPAIEVETILASSVEKMAARGFKLRRNFFGTDQSGCIFKAFALTVPDRKLGESPAQVASRYFSVPSKLIWSAVIGFDGKYLPPDTDSLANPYYQDWFAMGQRLATRFQDKLDV